MRGPGVTAEVSAGDAYGAIEAQAAGTAKVPVHTIIIAQISLCIFRFWSRTRVLVQSMIHSYTSNSSFLSSIALMLRYFQYAEKQGHSWLDHRHNTKDTLQWR